MLRGRALGNTGNRFACAFPRQTSRLWVTDGPVAARCLAAPALQAHLSEVAVSLLCPKKKPPRKGSTFIGANLARECVSEVLRSLQALLTG
jgi:hypothetical protein